MRSHQMLSSLVMRAFLLLAMLLFASAIFELGACNVDEPSLCEELGGFCASPDEPCPMNSTTWPAMGCPVAEARACCMPEGSEETVVMYEGGESSGQQSDRVELDE